MKPSLSGAGSVKSVITKASSEKRLVSDDVATAGSCFGERLPRRTRMVTTVALFTKSRARIVTTAIFVLDQVISARVPFTSDAVVAVAAVVATARVTGAAGAALAESTVTRIAAGTTTPR